MLVLTRRDGQSVVLRGKDKRILARVRVELVRGKVRLAFDADAGVEINREEIDAAKYGVQLAKG